MFSHCTALPCDVNFFVTSKGSLNTLATLSRASIYYLRYFLPQLRVSGIKSFMQQTRSTNPSFGMSTCTTLDGMDAMARPFSAMGVNRVVWVSAKPHQRAEPLTDDSRYK